MTINFSGFNVFVTDFGRQLSGMEIQNYKNSNTQSKELL